MCVHEEIYIFKQLNSFWGLSNREKYLIKEIYKDV